MADTPAPKDALASLRRGRLRIPTAADSDNAEGTDLAETIDPLSEAAAPDDVIGAEYTASPFFKAYLRFLNLAASARQAREQEQEIDPNEQALLELVILRWASGSPLAVRQTIAQAHLGSPATLHKRLMRLRIKTFLGLQDVVGDKRLKHLVPGPKGLTYIEQMGKHLLSARRGARTPARSEAQTDS